MPRGQFNWSDFETAVCVSAERVIRRAMREYPNENAYAAAFHEFYAEEWQVIREPCLALNTLEEIADSDRLKWSPADWYWTDLEYLSKRAASYFDRLNSEANRGDADHWHKTHDRLMRSMVRIAKDLGRRLKPLNVTRDFGVYVFANNRPDGPEILRKCMSKGRFARFFPHLHERTEAAATLADASIARKLASYREDLHLHRDKILAIGIPAVSMLIDYLNEPKRGWLAASMLGQLGLREDRIIRALRSEVQRKTRNTRQAMCSLALLGDLDYLFKLAEQKITRTDAVRAIKILYSSNADSCVVHVPLDYAPIEQLLSRKKCAAEVRKAYSSGGVYEFALPSREIQTSDLDEAIRGTKSRHSLIREHAVSCLGNRKLGKAAGSQALPAIATLLDDSCFNVQRLAMIKLSYWKQAAKPYVPKLKKLTRDDDAEVREWARYSLREM